MHWNKPILDKNKGIMKSFGMFLKESFVISSYFVTIKNNKVLSIKVLNIASDTDMRRSGCWIMYCIQIYYPKRIMVLFPPLRYTRVLLLPKGKKYFCLCRSGCLVLFFSCITLFRHWPAWYLKFYSPSLNFFIKRYARNYAALHISRYCYRLSCTNVR